MLPFFSFLPPLPLGPFGGIFCSLFMITYKAVSVAFDFMIRFLIYLLQSRAEANQQTDEETDK